MKFTDGNWLLQPGLQAHHPAEAYDLTRTDETLVVDAPTHRISHRGDTLQGPVLRVRLGAPLPGVISVTIEHWTGAAGCPMDTFSRPTSAAKPTIEISADAGVLHSGPLSARIGRGGDWKLSFHAAGHRVTHSELRGIGYIEWPDHGRFMHERLALGVGECVYGFGERFTAFVKNGQVVENWNKDGGTCSEQSYKCVPFYMTNRGYGVLVNDAGPVSFEVASERVSQVQFSVPGDRLEYFLIYGPTPKEILARLTALTGRPALPPAWSFGLWLSTSFTTNYDEATVTGFIDGMKERDLPLHVFHFDCFWMREFEWCNFEWDPRTFSDPAGMLRRLRARGLKICVWINPYIAQRSPLFSEGKAKGYLLRRANGEVWQSDLWQPGMGIVDFTNPEARAWYNGYLRRLLEMGVDCFKTDFGERIPTDVVYHDGADPLRMHNQYSVLYNETVFELLREVRGEGEAVVFARASHTSGQQFPVHWGGDSNSTFESMAESLRGGLSLGLCGFGFWSHDIGGFEGLPDPAVYKRWVAFGLLSSHSRLHGSSSYRVPWAYNDEACDVLRFFTKLKCRLMPYLFQAAVEAHEEGTPLMRPMFVEYPSDPACAHLDRQYFLGGSVLVVPVLSVDGWAEYYLPEGRWTHLTTGEVLAGGRWHRTQHDYLALPLFARPGAVIAFGAHDDRPDYAFTENITFRAYEIPDGAMVTASVPTEHGRPGIQIALRRRGCSVEAEVSGPAADPWQLQLIGVPSIGPVSNAQVNPDPCGVTIVPNPGTHHLSITLAATPAIA